MRRIWTYLLTLLRKPDKPTVNVSENKVELPNLTVIDQEHTDSQISIVLKTIMRHFHYVGKFTSNELWIKTKEDGYDLTQKQIWRVVSKLSKFDYINKIVLDSKTSGSYYVLTQKYYHLTKQSI